MIWLTTPRPRIFPHDPPRRDRDGALLDREGEELLDREVEGFDLDVEDFDREVEGFDREVEDFDREVEGLELEPEDEVELFLRSGDLKSVRTREPRLFDRGSGVGVITDSRRCEGSLEGERR